MVWPNETKPRKATGIPGPETNLHEELQKSWEDSETKSKPDGNRNEHRATPGRQASAHS